MEIRVIKFVLLIIPITMAKISVDEHHQGWAPSNPIFIPGRKASLPMTPMTNSGSDSPPSLLPVKWKPAVEAKGVSVKFSQKYSHVKSFGGLPSRQGNEVTSESNEVKSTAVASSGFKYVPINGASSFPGNKSSNYFYNRVTGSPLPPGYSGLNISTDAKVPGRIPTRPAGVIQSHEGSNSVPVEDQCNKLRQCKKSSNVKRQDGIGAIGALGEIEELDSFAFNNGNNDNKKMYICWINTSRYRIPLEVIVFILRFSNACFSIPTSIGKMLFESMGDTIMRIQDNTWVVVDNFKNFLRRVRRRLFLRLLPSLNRLRGKKGPLGSSSNKRPRSLQRL